MRIEKTFLEGCVLIYPDCFKDNRGWFMESYHHDKYHDLGISSAFVQDNHSYSKECYTLRGLHFQTGNAAQSKLVRCVKGKIWDVAVDLRSESPTYKQWIGVVLDAENKTQIFIPKGFAHGFLTLEPDTEVEYKVDHVYSKAHDGGIAYNDPELHVDWSTYLDGNLPILSEKDMRNPNLKELSLSFKDE